MEKMEAEIARLIKRDDDINRQEIDLFCQKARVRKRLRCLRKQKREAIAALDRPPGRPPTISLDTRCQQVQVIKQMRATGKKWREIAKTLGYKNHPECIRILKVYGKEI